MATVETKPGKVNLKNVRVRYLNAFEKASDRKNDQGVTVEGKYQVTSYLEKDDPQIDKLYTAAEKVLTEALGSAESAEKWMKKHFGFGSHSPNCAIRDLAQRDNLVEGFEEGIYFKAAGHKSPRIVTSLGETQNLPGGKPIKGLTVDGDDIEGSEIYDGCYANISIEIYWYAKFKNLMVDFLGIRFRGDGEAFRGEGTTASDSDLDDDDEKPAKPKRRPSRDEDDDEPAPRRKSRREEPEDDEDDEPAPRRRNRG